MSNVHEALTWAVQESRSPRGLDPGSPSGLESDKSPKVQDFKHVQESQSHGVPESQNKVDEIVSVSPIGLQLGSQDSRVHEYSSPGVQKSKRP